MSDVSEYLSHSYALTLPFPTLTPAVTSNLMVVNGDFTSNNAILAGGALFMNAGHVTVSGSTQFTGEGGERERERERERFTQY